MNTSSKVVRAIGVALALLAGIGLVVSSLPLTFFTPTPLPEKTMSDFPADFSFEIVSTPEARTQGLSGRSEVPSNYGMFFVFESSDRYGFWMKDMLVPIDMIWLSEDGKIIGIEHAVGPDTFPQTFTPETPARFVLETRAGEARRLNLEIGDQIPLPVL